MALTMAARTALRPLPDGINTEAKHDMFIYTGIWIIGRAPETHPEKYVLSAPRGRL